jgi:antitoxin MazE
MATVQMWGNSLAIRIPTALAGQLHVTDGSAVDLELRDGELVIRPVDRRTLRLADLLKDCKPSQLHGETDFGADVGREVVE